jgi:hypothetical protein
MHMSKPYFTVNVSHNLPLSERRRIREELEAKGFTGKRRSARMTKAQATKLAGQIEAATGHKLSVDETSMMSF